MKKIISSGLIGGLAVLLFIIIFTNLFGADPVTLYKDLIDNTFVEKYHLNAILGIFIIVTIFIVYSKSKKM